MLPELGTAFLAGALALLSPCAAPILPGIVGALTSTGNGRARPSRQVWSILAFAVGAALVLIGSVALLLAFGANVNLARPPYTFIAGGLLIGAGLYSLGASGSRGSRRPPPQAARSRKRCFSESAAPPSGTPASARPSPPLVADGVHARLDGFTSLSVVLGAIGVLLGFPLADPIIGLLIAVSILVLLWGTVKSVGARLMDAIAPDLLERAEHALEQTPGVTAVEDLRLRWIGHRLTGSATLRVAADQLVDATRIAQHAGEQLHAAIGNLDIFTLTPSPGRSGKPALSGAEETPVLP
ncbi:hypothetical protein C5C27_15325 [Rathayibacter sp. AY2B7]|uniref:cation transporter n=1 Tax=Rathayibacter sp. AY2B7 TaxID=2080571 RepID=UPI000CE88F98|nr:cation transporter [Rathayibacter sp. AY2B7]PPG54481.1 hypothetical protein C5C27_15325 [Rathayibacter sp. AY2B7]